MDFGGEQGGARGAPVVLVVDDAEEVCASVGSELERAGCVVRTAGTGRGALAHLDDETIEAVVLDWRLPDVDGFDILRALRSRPTAPPVIMLTGHSSVEHAVDAMKLGAWDYVTKPFDLDHLLSQVRNAVAVWRGRGTEQEVASGGRDPLTALVGQSPPMRHVKALLRRIARGRGSTLLLTGESGTGKDVAARAVHEQSDRWGAPFMNITCSALPSSLLESELFGHERGAFTDASERKLGLLERADGGTVFLDEIGEMHPSMQAKLLRFLEQKKLRRVGGTEEVQPDVRIVAATNVDLSQAVAQGGFREDLYYRLAVLPVHMPALRERDGDVSLLVSHFLAELDAELGRRGTRVSPEALQVLEQHDWPGNVRELRNVLERAMLLGERETLQPEDFQLLGAGGGSPTPTGLRLPPEGVDLKSLERRLVEEALERTSGNRTRAAKLLGMNRDQIRYRIRKYELGGDGDEAV